MLRLPQSIIFAIIALNITVFTLFLQMDWLFFNAPWEKFLAWFATVIAWTVTYKRRRKFFTIL